VIAASRGRYAEALQYLQTAVDIRNAMGHRWGVSVALVQMGTIARRQGDDVASMHYLLQALQAANDVQAPPAILTVLCEIAANLAQAGSHDQAIQLLTAILHHPASDSALGNRAGALLIELGVDTVALQGEPVQTGREDIEHFTREMLQQTSTGRSVPEREPRRAMAHNSC